MIRCCSCPCRRLLPSTSPRPFFAFPAERLRPFYFTRCCPALAVSDEDDNVERTVFVGGLPLAVAEGDLRAVFPTAEAIHVKDGRM